MAWQVSGDMYELCSCNILCPCWLGPEPKPDKGWCSGILGFDIHRGTVEGIDVGGRKVVLAAEWPGNFFGGNGTARLYIDSRASADHGNVSIRVGHVGQATLKPLRDEKGRPVSVQGTAAQAAFQSANMEVASGQGSRWTDPELRGWDGDSGTIHKFDWRS